MRLAHLNLRAKILIGALLALAAVWAVSSFQVRSMEKQLDVLAQQRAQEARAGGAEVTTNVTVTRQYLLFGQPKGKIEVFSRVNSGPQAGQIESIAYYYARQHGKWTCLESGRCSGPECQLRGREAFAAAKQPAQTSNTTSKSAE